MFTKSLWNSFAGNTDFPKLEKDIQVDVAIVGGGITGITTAQLLSQSGLKVAVLEARKVGGGTTSHSTGNLYYTIGSAFIRHLQKEGVAGISGFVKSIR